jgi:opacity protein-like surface antigen
MVRWIRIGSIAAASVALSSVSFGQGGQSGTGWESGLDIVFQGGKTLHFDGGTNAKLDSDTGLSLTFGYRYSTHLEAQFALDWANVDYKANIVTAPTTGPASSVSANGSYNSFTPRVNVQFNVLDQPLTPYVMGGIGYSFIDTNIPNGRPVSGCWWDPWYGYICGSAQPTKSVDGFAFQVGLGARWDISELWSLRLAWERHWVDLGSNGGTPFLDTGKLGFTYRF